MMTRDDGRVANGVAGTAVSPETSDPRLEAAGLSRRLALILLGGAALAACSPTSRPSGGDTLLPAPTGPAISGEVLGTGTVRVALLLPKTAPGNGAALAAAMQNAASLGLTDFSGNDLTVLVKDGGDTVTFWSSNMPDGYGAKTVPKSQIRRVIFTRITRPERFNLAPAVGSHPWLSSLLRQEVGIKEVRRYSGMQNP